MRVYEQFKGRIHSISEMRSLWIPEGNPYHQAFRILSSQYLRHHYLERTFNSRVENYSVHMKYRQRLLDGLKNPEHFTVLKTDWKYNFPHLNIFIKSFFSDSPSFFLILLNIKSECSNSPCVDKQGKSGKIYVTAKFM
jgi:hypothetical protein